MNINLYENKSGHYEHIYFIIKLYENKPGHYKHIYFNIKLYENKSGHYCNLGNDWSHWTLTGFPSIPFVSLVNSVGCTRNANILKDQRKLSFLIKRD